MAIGEIIEEQAPARVEILCDTAEREHSLHGDPVFTKKLLDTALEQTRAIPGCRYSYRYNHSDEELLVDAYIKIATTAFKTGQDERYITELLDSAAELAVDEGGERRLDNHTISTIAQAAQTTEQSPDYMQGLAVLYYDNIRLAKPERVIHAPDFSNFIKHISSWGLPEEHQASFIERYRQDCKELKAPVNQADGLMSAADAAHKHLGEQDEVRSETTGLLVREAETAISDIEDTDVKISRFNALAKLAHETGQRQSYTRQILEAARLEASKTDDAAEEIGYLNSVAEAAEAVEESDIYEKLFDQGLQTALGQEEPTIAVTLTHLLLKTAINVGYADRATAILTPGIDFVRSVDTPDRQKHMLLNRLLRGVNVTSDNQFTNGIERKPLSFVFAR